MPTNRDLLTTTYKAFNSRDIEGVLAVLHPEVDWPNGWEGGRIQGHAGVRDYWMRQWAAINPRVEPTGFETDAEGRTVVRVHQVVRRLNLRDVAHYLPAWETLGDLLGAAEASVRRETQW